MENIGCFDRFSLSRIVAGGTPALPVAAWLGDVPGKELSRVVQVVSPHPLPKRVPVREAVFLVFNVDIPPVSRPSEAAQRHSRHSCRFPSPASHPHTWRTWRTWRETLQGCTGLSKLSPQTIVGNSRNCPPLVLLSFLFFLFPGNGPKIFSNRWKTGEQFFQSLEKRADFSNHWKNIFQSLEKLRGARGPADWPESGGGGRVSTACQSRVKNPRHARLALHWRTVCGIRADRP